MTEIELLDTIEAFEQQKHNLQDNIKQIDSCISKLKIDQVKKDVGMGISVGLDKILENSCVLAGVSTLAVKGKSRKRELKIAQHLYCKYAMSIVNEKYKFRSKYTLREVAKIINIDHSTVLYSVKTANNLIQTDREVRKIYNQLCKNLKK